MRSYAAVLLLVLGLSIPTSASATTLHVPSECPTIQAGIDSASAGDTVLVACGTYQAGNIEMQSGICLLSETGEAECVTIDAGQNWGVRAVHCASLEPTTIIKGFTFKGGRAFRGGAVYCVNSSLTIANCTLHDNAAQNRGGGLYCDNCSIILTDCNLRHNRTTQLDGGGVFCQNSSMSLVNCTFAANQAAGSGGGMLSSDGLSLTVEDCRFSDNAAQDGRGGGLRCGTLASSAIITRCSFTGNSASAVGGAISLYVGAGAQIADCSWIDNSATHGGALYLDRSDASLTRCVLAGNQASSDGGAIFAEDCVLQLAECAFIGNAALFGGAIRCYGLSVTGSLMSRCIFSTNQAFYNGGAIHSTYSNVSAIDCTIAYNSSGTCGGGIFCRNENAISLENTIVAFSTNGEAVHCYDTDCIVALSCCDIYGNEGGDWTGCIADQYGVGGNISEDPLFCAPDSLDFRIAAESPCAPDNSPPGCGLIGADSVGCTTAAVAADESGIPTALHLGPAVPNPFNPITEITYAIPQGAAETGVSLCIYDVLGRRVKTLVDTQQPAGIYRAIWDGNDQKGTPAASGVYFFRLVWEGKSRTQRAVLLK